MVAVTSISAWLLLAVATPTTGPVTLVAVRSESRPTGPAVRLVISHADANVKVDRQGDDILFRLRGRAARGLTADAPVPPVRSIGVTSDPENVTVRIGAANGTWFRVERTPGAITLLFDPPVATSSSGGDLEELYRRILPPPGDPGISTDTPSPAAPPRDGDEDAVKGFFLGSLRLAPSARLSYVAAEAALLETAQPVRDEYGMAEPSLQAELPVGTGSLKGSYTARIRRGSAYALVRETTHLADASVALPLGPALQARASEHFSRGTLETSEVDPGGEYFFGIGRFTRHRHSAGLRAETGAGLDIDLSGSLDRLRISDTSSFFGHDRRSAGIGLGYQLTPGLRATLGYGYERVPFTVVRPEAEYRAHRATLGLSGEVALLRTDLSVGFRDQRNPRGGAGGDRYRGLEASGTVTRSFTDSSELAVTVGRGTQVSAFERNAFYVFSLVQAQLRARLPVGMALDLGGGWHRNDYRIRASGLDGPRRDDLWGWSVGVGRGLTRHAALRVDYRHERRDSNLAAFDSHARALTAQLALGAFPGQR